MRPETVEMLRASALDYIKSFRGKWYKWGGDDPSGFDCSGLAIEFCKAPGILERGVDITADGLLKFFSPSCIVSAPYNGCLSFHTDQNGNAFHVEICVNIMQTIGASGGTSKTVTPEDAIRDNAFIKERPIRGNIFVDPFKKLLTG